MTANAVGTARGDDDLSTEASYLPDFCSGGMTFAIVLLAELIAFVLTLAQQPVGDAFWINLGRASLFLLWVGLGSAVVMCAASRFMTGLSTARITVISLVLLMAATAAVSEAAWWLGSYFSALAGGGGSQIFPATHLPFLFRNVLIAFVVSALVLRYFYVSHQWRRNVQMEARARIAALQARIRPHFLFNSMNTIAALTRSDPAVAEKAVEDLADLFRASLADNRQLVPLREEFEITRLYAGIEQLRLGDRLHVRWSVDELPQQVQIPGLTVQPLLENAIYHGIEPLPDGGTVEIRGRVAGGQIVIEIDNPVGVTKEARRHDGNRIALTNVKQRLELAFGGKAALETEHADGRFRVRVSLPAGPAV